MASAPIPVLLRTGDIGVATEWRSLVLDWTALLTELGTDIYTYLRDDYDQQRTLWPFLVPQGPTKRKVQTKLGRKSAVSLHGPQYLLAVVGLVSISYRRGATDPEHPNRTHVAYYSVGKLDYPQLDWSMLTHVLDALLDALDPAAAQHRQAQQALRALSRSGMFQPGDPADVFYDFGAWPALLPQMIGDARWEALFIHLHGPAALAPYRAAARNWCAAVARTIERRSARNQAILDTIQTMQHDPSGGPVTPPMAAHPSSATSLMPETTSHASPQAGDLRSPVLVPAKSLGSPQAADLRSGGLGTNRQRTQCDVITSAAARVPGESPDRESYTRINGGGCEDRDSPNVFQHDIGDSLVRDRALAPTFGDSSTPDPPSAGDISRYLREDELSSSCLDVAFWCAVNQIVHGTPTRYPHTAGERKALQRQFQRPGVPTGVVLAALRVVMDTPTPPATLAAALVHPAFQEAVAQARLLVSQTAAGEDTWSRFLWQYRTVQSTTLRQVSPDEHRALQQLFQQQPAACLVVLERIAQMATPPPRLTPRYLAQAVQNNLQAALERDLQAPTRTSCAPPGREVPRESPPRAATTTPTWSADEAAQIAEIGLRPGDLQPFAPTLVQAWLAAYRQRHAQISHPRNWVLWGLRSGVKPDAHPDLQRHGAQLVPASVPPPSPPNDAAQQPSTDPLWSRVLDRLRPQFPASEFATWLAPTALVKLDGDTAVIAVEHIFARDTLQTQYQAALTTALQAVVGQPLAVEIVIGAAVGTVLRS